LFLNIIYFVFKIDIFLRNQNDKNNQRTILPTKGVLEKKVKIYNNISTIPTYKNEFLAPIIKAIMKN